MSESLVPLAVGEHRDLVALVVADAIDRLGLGDKVQVAEIDPADADTAAFCARYGFPEERSANCVVVLGRRGEEETFCACVVLANSRVDVNGLVRRHLGAKKASFAPMERAVDRSEMAYGGITPLGLPASWPLLVDAAVVGAGTVVIGSGVRNSKLLLDGALLGGLPGAEVIEGLGLGR